MANEFRRGMATLTAPETADGVARFQAGAAAAAHFPEIPVIARRTSLLSWPGRLRPVPIGARITLRKRPPGPAPARQPGRAAYGGIMTGRTGKTRNIVLVWLVWPLITLGIYHLVWWYKINREARDFDARIAVNPVLSVLAVSIGALIIVPPFVSIYRTGERIAQMQEAAGLERSCNGVLGILGAFVVSLQSLYYQYELNRIWVHLGSPEEGTTITLPRAPAQAASQEAPQPGQ